MTNLKSKITSLVSILTVAFLLPVTVVFAQPQPAQPPQDYKVLAPLPGITTGNCSQNSPTTGTDPNCQTNISRYIPAAYRLAVGIAVALAFIMITVGGIIYATSDALSGKQDGRRYIENAVTGLLLVIGSWVILNTINPNILSFSFTINNVSGTNSGGQQQQPIDATNGCPNCVVMTGIPLKPGVGNKIDPTMYAKLQRLDTLMKANNIPWRVTEGFPPSRTHVSGCHTNATCIDANLIVNTQLDPKTKAGYLNAFSTYALQVGMSRVEYEVATDKDRTDLINAGYRGTVIVPRNCSTPPCISAPHFSVYN